MKLVIGGCAQGKLNFVLQRYFPETYIIFDGTIPDETVSQEKVVIINHFHNWVRERILAGGCPEEEITAFLGHRGDCVIISDEIGNGIVPIDRLGREYRERTGRLLVMLASMAEEVERVFCGIGQRIK